MNTDPENGTPPASPAPVAPPPKILDLLSKEETPPAPVPDAVPPPLPFTAAATVDIPPPPEPMPPAATLRKPLVVALAFSVVLLILAALAMMWTWRTFAQPEPAARQKPAPARPAPQKPAVPPAPTAAKTPAWTPAPRILVPTPPPEDGPRTLDNASADNPADEGKMGIQKLVLCRRVNGYGVFEPFNKNVFSSEEPPAILVYAEINRFKSVRQTNGRYAISLKLDLALLDALAKEKEIWKEDPIPVADECSSRRRDFYFAHFLALPEKTKPGSYILRATLTDEADGSVAVSSIPLTLTGK